jgi:hypothetical protein
MIRAFEKYAYHDYNHVIEGKYHLYIQNVPDCEKLCVLVSIVSEK